MSEGPTVTVACYNVHRCVGSDGQADPHRVGSVLQEIDPDILGLQEVSVEGEAISHQADFLADTISQTVVFGPTLSQGLLEYGNALMTSGEILSHRRHDLSVRGCEPRAALDVDLEVRGKTLRVVVTHIGLQRSERRVQIARLGEIVQDTRAPLTILLGDFNEWRLNAGRLAPLRRGFGRGKGNYRTFPASLPLLPLDRIWVRPPAALLDVRVHHSAAARRASDHLPLVARVSLG